MSHLGLIIAPPVLFANTEGIVEGPPGNFRGDVWPANNNVVIHQDIFDYLSHLKSLCVGVLGFWGFGVTNLDLVD